MPDSQDNIQETKSQANIQNNEINLSNNKHFDNNNNLFATNNLGIKLQDKNNNNFNNNYQQVSNKRRIDENSINNDCNNQLNKKFKREELASEEISRENNLMKQIGKQQNKEELSQYFSQEQLQLLALQLLKGHLSREIKTSSNGNLTHSQVSTTANYNQKQLNNSLSPSDNKHLLLSKTNTLKTNGPHEKEIETNKTETINECSNDTFAWSIKSLCADGKCQWIECEQKFEDIDSFKKHLYENHSWCERSREQCAFQSNHIRNLQRQIKESKELYNAMKQFCELTKPICNDLDSNEQLSITNTNARNFCKSMIKTQQICSNNDTKIDESRKSEELRLSMTNCLPQNNKSLNIENMSTSSQHDLTSYNRNFNKIESENCQQTPNCDVISVHSSVSNEVDEQQNGSVVKYTEGCRSVDSTSSDDVNKDVLKPKPNNISATNHNFLQSASPDNYLAHLNEDEISTDLERNAQYYAVNFIRPKHTYAQLIRQAIIQRPERQMTLNEIYNWFQNKFCFFRQNGPTWKTKPRFCKLLQRYDQSAKCRDF